MRKENLKQIQEVKKMILEEKGEQFLEEIIETAEEKQREAFLEGYQYAIQMLEDGLGQLNKNRWELIPPRASSIEVNAVRWKNRQVS